MIVILILVLTAVPMYQRYIRNSRNAAAQNMLRQIALAEKASRTEDCWNCEGYSFTDGVSETAEEAISRLTEFGFRPDPYVAFHIMPPVDNNGGTITSINGLPLSVPLERYIGFVAFAAHNSVGSTVYVFDSAGGWGINEAHENDVYSGITVTNSVVDLLCYKYDPFNTATPVKKKPNSVKFAPDRKDKYTARMVVTVAAK